MLGNSILTPLSTKISGKLSKRVSYLVLSDIHFGNRRNPATDMLQRLRTFFDDFSPSGKFVTLDVLFIAGDLFDAALWLSNEEVTHIFLFMRELMHWCETHGIRLRILEGTPSHDRGQSRNMVPLAKTFKHLNFAYINTMCVEGFYDLNMTCLYVNDEYAGSAKKAQELIQAELDSLGIDKVTIAIMHGMFKYQLPEISSDRFKYDESFFLQRVKAFINIGHVHVFTTYERIIAQGSTDRISHGEEKPKGGTLQILDPEGENLFFFIENKLACKFITLHIKQKDLDKAIQMVESKAASLPAFSYLRIKASKGHAIFNVLDQIKKKFTMLFFDRLTEEEELERQTLLDTHDLLNVSYVPIHITRENISDMILDEIKKKSELSGSTMILLQKQLQLLAKP